MCAYLAEYAQIYLDVCRFSYMCADLINMQRYISLRADLTNMCRYLIDLFVSRHEYISMRPDLTKYAQIYFPACKFS